jgi:hypothetical protein
VRQRTDRRQPLRVVSSELQVQMVRKWDQGT